MINKIILAGLILFIFAPFSVPAFAAIDASVPNNLSEAQQRGPNILNAVPGVLTQVWREFVAYLYWLVNWLIDLGKKYLYPPIKNLWDTQVQPREPAVQQEFQKEKTEIGTDIKNQVPIITKSIWTRFMELVNPPKQ